MNNSNEARELVPYEDFTGKGSGSAMKDFRLHPVKSESPDPKDESALASARSSKSPLSDEPAKSVQPAPTPADKANGKLNDKNEPSSSQTETTSQTESENSSPPSSGQTSPGWSEPPAPVVPPTKD